MASKTLATLRRTALIAVLAGTVGSLSLMLWMGRHNHSRLLVVLMSLWVLSPFSALILAAALAEGWSTLTRTMLYWLMLIVPFSSLAVYSYADLNPPAKPASVYVVVPPVSWLLTAMALSITAWRARKSSRSSDETPH